MHINLGMHVKLLRNVVGCVTNIEKIIIKIIPPVIWYAFTAFKCVWSFVYIHPTDSTHPILRY